jgi:hypothetical protein
VVVELLHLNRAWGMLPEIQYGNGKNRIIKEPSRSEGFLFTGHIYRRIKC